MTPRLAVQLALMALLMIGVVWFAGHYRALREAAAQNEQRGAVLNATTAGVADTTAIDTDQADRAAGLAAARDQFKQAKREAIHNEPETADRADRAVPDSLRAAYRERRLARERLGCAGRQCREDDATDAAAERTRVLR